MNEATARAKEFFGCRTFIRNLSRNEPLFSLESTGLLQFNNLQDLSKTNLQSDS